jgi:hypothetical protein
MELIVVLVIYEEKNWIARGMELKNGGEEKKKQS